MKRATLSHWGKVFAQLIDSLVVFEKARFGRVRQSVNSNNRGRAKGY